MFTSAAPAAGTKKNPVLELAYIKDQREKVGSKGKRQIGSANGKEHRRQRSENGRNDKKAENERKRKAKELEEIEAQTRRNTARESLNDSSSNEGIEDGDSDGAEKNELESPLKVARRNYSNISNVALAGLRFGVGLRPTAAIATAALVDGGLVTEADTSKVIDKSKVKRAQDKIMREMQ